MQASAQACMHGGLAQLGEAPTIQVGEGDISRAACSRIETPPLAVQTSKRSELVLTGAGCRILSLHGRGQRCVNWRGMHFSLRRAQTRRDPDLTQPTAQSRDGERDQQGRGHRAWEHGGKEGSPGSLSLSAVLCRSLGYTCPADSSDMCGGRPSVLQGCAPCKGPWDRPLGAEVLLVSLMVQSAHQLDRSCPPCMLCVHGKPMPPKWVRAMHVEPETAVLSRSSNGRPIGALSPWIGWTRQRTQGRSVLINNKAPCRAECYTSTRSLSCPLHAGSLCFRAMCASSETSHSQ